jgi:hypothetical protein
MAIETTVRGASARDTWPMLATGGAAMRATRSIRRASRGATSRGPRRRAQPVALFAIVDSGKIPAGCFGEPLLSVAATDRRSKRAYRTLCETLARNKQVGITAVDVGGRTQLAALLPIGRLLAVSPLQREYTLALAASLRAGARAHAQRPRRPSQERRAA